VIRGESREEVFAAGFPGGPGHCRGELEAELCSGKDDIFIN
jgi:hypothetical protein